MTNNPPRPTGHAPRLRDSATPFHVVLDVATSSCEDIHTLFHAFLREGCDRDNSLNEIQKEIEEAACTLNKAKLKLFCAVRKPGRPLYHCEIKDPVLSGINHYDIQEVGK